VSVGSGSRLHLALFQIWGLGDLVMTTPVIAEIRRLHPEAMLTLVVRGKAQADLMEGSPLVDRIVIIPDPRNRLALFRFFVGLRRERIDVAYIGTRITPLLALLVRIVSGVSTVIGDADRMTWPFSHHRGIATDEHRVDRMLATLALWTGEAPAAPSFPLPIDPAADERADRLLAAHGLEAGRYLAIHPGASAGDEGRVKRIPVDIVAQLLEALGAIDPEARAAIILGPDDADLQAKMAALGGNTRIVTGTSLPVTASVLSKARGFIGSDSSLGHIAAASGIPTITLAGPTSVGETRPFGAKARIVKRSVALDCQPCWGTPNYGRCPFALRCMRELPLDTLEAALRTWFERQAADVSGP